MSCILYYSRYCEVCKKYLQIFTKQALQNDMHFICIDKRVKDASGKTWILLENGEKIIFPPMVNRVPALLLLAEGQRVLFGEQILAYFKPRQVANVREATQNNMEPMDYSFGSGGFKDIVSDQYSFLDQSPEELKAAEGNGGMRQMHNYINVNDAFSGKINGPGPGQGGPDEGQNTTIRGSQKRGDDESNQWMEERIRKEKEARDADLRMFSGPRPI